MPFYLTGGTALGRFFLHHRFSEDLDFFQNSNPDFNTDTKIINKNISKYFDVDISKSLFTQDFVRYFVRIDNNLLKIEFVNDVEYHVGKPYKYKYGLVDIPSNILANKLTALMGRDEPKDVFDIVSVALNYSFNWQDIFFKAKQKSMINELDIEQRLFSFPVELLSTVDWIAGNYSPKEFKTNLATIADDFLLGKDNSLGLTKTHIDRAAPIL